MDRTLSTLFLAFVRTIWFILYFYYYFSYIVFYIKVLVDFRYYKHVNGGRRHLRTARSDENEQLNHDFHEIQRSKIDTIQSVIYLEYEDCSFITPLFLHLPNIDHIAHIQYMFNKQQLLLTDTVFEFQKIKIEEKTAARSSSNVR